MQSASQKTSLDWATLTARWLFLFALSVWLAFNPPLNLVILALALVGLLFNLALTVFVGMNVMPRWMRVGAVALDLALAHLALSLGNLSLSLLWIVLLPVVSGALYLRWLGALGVSALNGVVVGGLSYLFYPGQLPLAALVGLAASLLLGLPLAAGGARLAGAPGGKKAGPLNLEAERKERERRSTIFEMISALNESLNYQRVLENALDLSANTLDNLQTPQTDKLVSAVLLFAQSERDAPVLQVATSRNLIPADRSATLPGSLGLLSDVIEEGQPQLSQTVRNDPELSRLNSFRDCGSAYGLPLRTGLDAYGVLLFAHPDVDFFAPDRREVLEIVGKQSIIAIQNARLYQDLEQEKNRMMEIQEDSRKKLARDLHDGPTQSVSAIAMRVNFARRLMERDPKAAADELYKIEDLARRTTKEIRHMLFTLRPLVLESQGLVAALQSMAEKMQETFNQNVIIQADPGVAEQMEGSKQAVVFYIAEEAVNNARKHAQAAHIWVRMKSLRDNMTLLEIEDDGVGFDVNAVGATYENRGSLGMINLRERTQLVNGVLRIDSAKGQGTRVQVVIPLTEEAADRIHRAV